MPRVNRVLSNAVIPALLIAPALAAEPGLEQDRAAILAMAGVYTVTFDFRETVQIATGYELHAPYHTTAAVELVEVVEDEPRRIVLQHLLVSSEGVVTKHWRQDWLHENRDLYEYAGSNTWRHRRLAEDEARGTWTQRVYQVDDSPRYQGHGRWSHADGLSSWQSDWTWRPLPRREHTKRDDYDVLVSRNRHTVTHTGWVHEQDSYKLVLRDGERRILAREAGLDAYDHVDPAKADAARGYWGRTAPFWKEVRAAWERRLVPGASVSVRPSMDDATLWQAMLDLAERYTDDPSAAAAGIGGVLEKYLGDGAVEVTGARAAGASSGRR
jgi:hypothetical protein